MYTKGLENCIYAYYGLGHLRCSRPENEGCICKEKCSEFIYSEVEID